MRINDTYRSVLCLSSGTIASLTGFTLYDKIDIVQWSFCLYCEDVKASGPWQVHWAAFWSGR